jgi:hypothetical protein
VNQIKVLDKINEGNTYLKDYSEWSSLGSVGKIFFEFSSEGLRVCSKVREFLERF